MKKQLISFFLFLQLSIIMPFVAYAQTEKASFIRQEGFFIRPELYGAILGELGYQFNPNLQLSMGFGVEIGDNFALPELIIGARAYATDTKWTAFFDYHIGLIFVDAYAFVDHRFTIGPCYKNFDFGGGIMYMNIDGAGYWGPCLNIGYNFRIGNKQ